MLLKTITFNVGSTRILETFLCILTIWSSRCETEELQEKVFNKVHFPKPILFAVYANNLSEDYVTACKCWQLMHITSPQPPPHSPHFFPNFQDEVKNKWLKCRHYKQSGGTDFYFYSCEMYFGHTGIQDLKVQKQKLTYWVKTFTWKPQKYTHCQRTHVWLFFRAVKEV